LVRQFKTDAIPQRCAPTCADGVDRVDGFVSASGRAGVFFTTRVPVSWHGAAFEPKDLR
jgi:hypothetical protein